MKTPSTLRVLALTLAASSAPMLVLSTAATTRALEPQARVGGFRAGSKTDPEVLKAAQFAVAEQAKKKGIAMELVSVESVEQQVVAGMNYKLRMTVKIAGKPQPVTATVWRKVPLSEGCALTSWEP
jgi:hypothetical protein